MNNYTDEDVDLEDELYKSRKLREEMNLEFEDEEYEEDYEAPKRPVKRNKEGKQNSKKKVSAKKVFTYLFMLYGPISAFR